MLDDLQIQDAARSRAKVLIPAMIFAVVAVFAYLGLVAIFRDSMIGLVGRVFGDSVAGFAPVLMILPSIAVFLVPCAIAEKYATRFATICPLCSADITRSTQQVLATRRCSKCDGRIVSGGRQHDVSVYKRYCQIESRRFLGYWFWAWPLLGVAALAWHAIDNTALVRCPHFLFVPGLIGTTAGAWTVFRTYDRRYWPPTIVSSVVLIVGCIAFWQTI